MGHYTIQNYTQVKVPIQSLPVLPRIQLLGLCKNITLVNFYLNYVLHMWLNFTTVICTTAA